MLATLAAFVSFQATTPKTWDGLMAEVRKAYQSLHSYSDSWEFVAEGSPTRLLCERAIDGKRSFLRFAYSDRGSAATPILAAVANGKVEFALAYPSKQYYLQEDQGDFFRTGSGIDMTPGSFSMRVESYGFVIAAKPALALERIETKKTDVGKYRLATAKAYNPETKNRLTVEAYFEADQWIATDFVATIQRADGTKSVVKLHSKSVDRNAKLPASQFELDPASIKDFTRTTKAELLKSISNGDGGSARRPK